MEQEQEQENYEFTDDQREEILKQEFNCKHRYGDEIKKKKITDIIDSVIDAIKDDGGYKKCIRKDWFTKQI